MSEIVIQVDNLSKNYRLGVIGGRRLVDDVSRRWAKLRGKPDPLSKVVHQPRLKASGQNGSNSDEIWALREVSFEVKEGEVLGIIGSNGAGKSTLLKVLSRVTAPTIGEVRVKGRIASLLEVGTGFHPELTGRENIFLNGAILGMTKDEIRKKFDEIVAFSGVEQFIDTPVKRYSSGMYVRLAFAVAAHLEPEIMIVDEVLAVGDGEFQKKCLGKMHDVAREGRTVLFVSHNMTAVQSLCSRALLLEKGDIELDADAATTTARYMSAGGAVRREIHWSESGAAPGNDAVWIRRIRIDPETDDGSDLITMKSPIRVETAFHMLKPDRTLHLTYHLLNQNGITVLTTGSQPRRYPVGDHVGTFCLPGELLNSGDYFLRLLIVENERSVTYRQDSVVSFTVAERGTTETSYYKREPGVVQPPILWRMSDNGTAKT